MRILTIEELMQVTGGGLTKLQKEAVKALKKSGDKDGAKALKKQYYAANKSAKSSSGKCTKSGSGSGKGTCLPPPV